MEQNVCKLHPVWKLHNLPAYIPRKYPNYVLLPDLPYEFELLVIRIFKSFQVFPWKIYILL